MTDRQGPAELETGRRFPGPGGLRNTDVFAAFNAFLFVLMANRVYFAQYVGRNGAGTSSEFFFYAVVIVIWITAAAILLRRFRWPLWILALIQIGILAHFAGGLLTVDGQRLYDHRVFGLGYDKIVHVFNSFAGTASVGHILYRPSIRLPLRAIAIVLISLGTGAVIEICEYVVTLTFPHHGVGDYDNNMQDLIANGVGALLYVLAAEWVVARARSRAGEPGP